MRRGGGGGGGGSSNFLTFLLHPPLCLCFCLCLCLCLYLCLSLSLLSYLSLFVCLSLFFSFGEAKMGDREVLFAFGDFTTEDYLKISQDSNATVQVRIHSSVHPSIHPLLLLLLLLLLLQLLLLLLLPLDPGSSYGSFSISSWNLVLSLLASLCGGF